ncbi:hypothetical protein CDAR_414971 [Caerostris darwini]|uniref:Uncharacterized protein n=1 Tax=Caerostris darwini TaxID=1538125 RepID=A0AAV4MC44_9ARAC|nr:hypothetical protein CDAR_414971 [Caerostris darwini]
MITDSPILTEAEHCSHITATQTQVKDREKAVDMMQQIIRHQGVLIDEGLMKPTALKPTLEGLKKAEDALAETTKRITTILFHKLYKQLKHENVSRFQSMGQSFLDRLGEKLVVNPTEEGYLDSDQGPATCGSLRDLTLDQE